MTENCSDYETICIERRGAADWLTLNRPERLNALNQQMVDELHDYLARAAKDVAVRVIVMRGAGRAFCAGFDIQEATIGGLTEPMEKIVHQRRYSGLIKAMIGCPQPIVALVQGAATGGGFSLALAADVRIAGHSARMNAAYIRVGFSGADMGSSYLLPRLVGLSTASELLLTGRFVDADRALRIGLVSEVVTDDSLESAGQALVDDMLATSPFGLMVTKEALKANIDNNLDAAIALEDRHQILCSYGRDVEEGIRAFNEKRQPRFGGSS